MRSEAVLSLALDLQFQVRVLRTDAQKVLSQDLPVHTLLGKKKKICHLILPWNIDTNFHDNIYTLGGTRTYHMSTEKAFTTVEADISFQGDLIILYENKSL